MNNQLKYIIPDTSIHLSSAAKKELGLIGESYSLITAKKELAKQQLIDDNRLATIKTGTKNRVYNPKKHEMTAIRFKIKPFAVYVDQDGVTQLPEKEEKTKRLCRRFIANWVLGEREINSFRARYYIRLYTKIWGTISFPNFMTDEFNESIKDTNIKSQRLTAKISVFKCNYCNHQLQTTIEVEEAVCPDCGNIILT